MDSQKILRRAALASPGIYCLFAIALIAQQPGIHYDEALPAMPAVHLSRTSGPPTYAHDPHTWMCIGDRCAPLMNLRYVGAVKDLLYLPLWAAAGPSVEAFRLLSMLMGAIGVVGVAAVLARFAGWREAATGSLMLAVHPAYLQQTVFDSGLIASWMLAFGFLGLTLTAYSASPDAKRAFLLGVACGFAVWARANFVWLLAAIAFAAVFTLRTGLARHRQNIGFLVFGGMAGGSPFLLYQWLSRGGTLQALSMYPADRGLLEVLPARLVLLAETLLSDREHRAMWGGADMAIWQTALMVGLALVALVAAWRLRSGFPRAAVLAALIFTAILLTSRMAIGEHHLIAIVPLVAIVAGIGARARFAAPLLIAYAGLALAWDAKAILGLSDTRGRGLWSDGSATLARELARRGDEVVFIDWGLYNQIYFLTGGSLRAREVFGDETVAESGETWTALVVPDRLFVTNGPAHRAFPRPTQGVRSALASRPNARRIGIPEHDGGIYAEVLFESNR